MKKLKKFSLSLLLVVLMAFSFVPKINANNVNECDLYFIWNDSEGNFHKKLIENVGLNTGDALAYTYKSEEDIGDNYKLSYGYELIYKAEYEAIENDPEFIAANDKVAYLNKNHITINPLRSIKGANSISHMGDMAFRFIAYRSNYLGLQLLNTNNAYKPDFIGGLFYEDHFDISGTTKEKPVIVQASILNDEVIIKNVGPTNFYKSVKALDVSSKAVSVSNYDRGFKIKFNSNYYDRVVFEVTTSDNKVGYVMIARDSLNISNMGREREKIQATLYYTKEHSYKDYQLVANINYKNGSKETKVLNPVKEAEHDTNRDPYEYEAIGDFESGENKLKKCQFVLENAKNIESVYFTVIKAGATQESNTYKGTFAGSNDGVKFGKINENDNGVIYYEGMVA